MRVCRGSSTPSPPHTLTLTLSSHTFTNALFSHAGDVDATLDYGFDSIKLDGCGAQRDLTLYANLFNQTGKAIMCVASPGQVYSATAKPFNPPFRMSLPHLSLLLPSLPLPHFPRIENCHWGGTVPNATWLVFNVRSPAPPISLLNECAAVRWTTLGRHPGKLTPPISSRCPWNYFRTSGDVRASYSSVVSNLQTTIQWAENGLSAPGCWA